MSCTDEIAFQALILQGMAKLLTYPDGSSEAAALSLRDLFEDESPEYSELSKIAAAAKDSDLLDLERDYTSLFIGALDVKAVPFASFYLDGKRQLNGPSTRKIAERYKASGLTHDPKRKQPEDHIATMLEYLFALLCKANASEGKEQEELIKQAKGFYAEFLKPMIGPFSGSVAQFARTDFYEGIGQVLPTLLIKDWLLDDLVQ